MTNNMVRDIFAAEGGEHPRALAAEVGYRRRGLSAWVLKPLNERVRTVFIRAYPMGMTYSPRMVVKHLLKPGAEITRLAKYGPDVFFGAKGD